MAGLFEGLDLSRRLQNPLVQMGAQMMANSGPSLTPKGLFEGAPQAIARGLQMQQEQQKLDQEEAAKNQTLELLRTEDPELAAMIEAGNIDAKSAIGLLMDKRAQESGWAREDSRDMRRRGWEVEDRDYNANRPDMVSYEVGGDILRGNRNDPNADLSVWHDGPDPAPKAPNIETFYDEATGMEFKGYVDPRTNEIVRMGGVKAPSNGLSITTSDGTVIQQGGSGHYDKAVDTGFGNIQKEIQTKAMSAVTSFDTLNAMEQTMADPTFYSGQNAEQVLWLKRSAAALGIDPEGVTSMEQFNALSKRAALDAMGGSLGAGFSNADRDFVDQQVANLGNTPEGNRQLIAMQRAIAQRNIAIANRAAQYEQQNGKLDPAFVSDLAAWAHENPLFVSDAQDNQSAGGQRRTSTGVTWDLGQ